MCNFGGGGSSSASTTPAYIPPAQTTTTGAAGAVAAPGVQVRGQSSRYESRNTAARSVRSRGGSGGQVDGTASTKRRRTSSLGL